MANVESILKIDNGKIINAVDSAEKVVDFANVEVPDGSIVRAMIGGSAISASKIAYDSISTIKVQDGAITNPKLATNAVTTDKITNFSVTNTKLANGAVTNIKIDDGAVTTSKIASVGLSPGVTGCALLVRPIPSTYSTSSFTWVAMAYSAPDYTLNPISGATWQVSANSFKPPELGWYTVSACIQCTVPGNVANQTFVLGAFRNNTLLDEVALIRRPQATNFRQLLTVSDYYFPHNNTADVFSLRVGTAQSGDLEIASHEERKSWIIVKKVGPL